MVPVCLNSRIDHTIHGGREKGSGGRKKGGGGRKGGRKREMTERNERMDLIDLFLINRINKT